jgi:hypothetical protein
MMGKPGLLLAAILLAELIAARMLLSADRERVSLAGTPIVASCSFKQRFGIPCPACGMSRSFVLALHGDVATAMDLNPGGPILVFGIAYFIGAMLCLSLRRRVTTKPRIQWCTATLGMGLIAVVCVHWIRAVWRILASVS